MFETAIPLESARTSVVDISDVYSLLPSSRVYDPSTVSQPEEDSRFPK